MRKPDKLGGPRRTQQDGREEEAMRGNMIHVPNPNGTDVYSAWTRIYQALLRDIPNKTPQQHSDIEQIEGYLEKSQGENHEQAG